MSRISLILPVLAVLVLSVALPAPAPATTVEVSLPGLLGTYDEQTPSRTVTFHLVDPPGMVYGASLRVAGTTEVGVINCEGVLHEWPTMLSGRMEDTPLHDWYATFMMPYVAGPFAATASFETLYGYEASWNFLRDGTGALTLDGGASGFIMICSPVSPPPTVTVTEAVLIVDAEFPIRTEASTWGRIKALYR